LREGRSGKMQVHTWETAVCIVVPNERNRGGGFLALGGALWEEKIGWWEGEKKWGPGKILDR